MCLTMAVCLLAGCADKEDPGAELDIYLGQTTNFDPATAFNDQDASQFLSFVYEGLTKIDSSGKVVAGMAKKWTVKDNVVEFKLKATRWSDGTYVAAKDFVYAWKTRLLNPEFECEAASLLFYVENAANAKNGDCSIDDVMIQASGRDILTVTLIDACYVDEFLCNCANVALSPVRSDALLKITVNDPYYGPLLHNDLRSYSWSTLNSVLLANGPFYVKKISLKDSTDPYITLERNKYYLTDDEKEEALQKFVKPYRLNVHFVDPATAVEKFNNGELLLNANIALASREEMKSKAKIKDQLATYSYYFNTENELFKDAKVRTALSMALDRNEIANIVVFGKAADGLISPAARYTGKKSSFRDKAGSVINTSADVAGAKALLQQAGVKSGSFTITCRNDEASVAVAKYAAGVWKELGFSVTVKELGYRTTTYEMVAGKSADGSLRIETVYDALIKDLYNEALEDHDFDVIGIDFAMLSCDAFSSLARFATKYSGGAYDFSEAIDASEKTTVTAYTGYRSAEYDAFIESVIAETDDSKRAALLVEAEKLLLGDMPVLPLYYMQSAYVASSNLTGAKTSGFGYLVLTKATDKTYKYVPVEALIPSAKVSDLVG